MQNKLLYLVVIITFVLQCQKDTIPKPYGELQLTYPKPTYEKVIFNCPFQFEKSSIARIQPLDKSCWMDLNYPLLKGSLHLSYTPVNNNLFPLIQDVQKFSLDHTKKATSFDVKEYINEERRVYGNYYELGGAVATPIQFYLTDSTHHLISGSLYFNCTPNPDSLQPAIEYIKNDILRLMETMEWNYNR